jgi:two-component system, OmpR family, phosphate regulon sensor histidine kinase PhoR
MNKKVIWIVSVFMGLAMVSLILVQAYWIRNAIIVKEKQFDQLIQRSMIDIADEIEKQEVAKIVSHIVDPSKEIRNYKGKKNKNEPGSGDEPNVAIGSVQQNNKEFWLKNRREFVDGVIAGMLYVSPEIENRITAPELEYAIRKVLDESGINLPFEYVVTRWTNDIAFRSPAYDPVAEAEYYRVQLFRNDLYPNDNFLTIYFPDKQDFLFRSLSYLAFSSLILSLAILVSFALTVFIMFRQKKLSEIRSDFVSNMTHELKTPISTISLASQLLSDKSIPDEVKKTEQISRIITEECRRLGSQVEKVLQTAVFDKGRLKLKLGEVNMHELITGIIENFTLQIRSRNGNITSNLEAQHYLIQADHVHITNLLSNLLDNAIKYCNRNPEIIVETADKKDFLMISVKDNGIGLAKSELKRIFEKFYRVPTGNVHTVKGFGLGLSYVKMIAEEHHGRVDVESEIYQGSTFRVFLPLNEPVVYAKN